MNFRREREGTWVLDRFGDRWYGMSEASFGGGGIYMGAFCGFVAVVVHRDYCNQEFYQVYRLPLTFREPAADMRPADPG